MEAKKKIFISSSLRDLREYRRAVTDELQRFLDIDVLKNDMMDATPDQPQVALNKLIDESDIFIGIYAYRYGTIPEGQQVSYIEQEYDYARSLRKPIFAFIVDRNQSWPPDMIETDQYLAGQMGRFKDRLFKELTAAFFTTPEDLAKKVYEAVKRYLGIPDVVGEVSQTVVTPTTSDVLGYIEKDKNPKTDSDRPSGLDRLNYSRYAQAFARIVLNHETSTPLTIGIYGQWGQGKSFLMGKIKEALINSRETIAPFYSLGIWKKYDPKAIWGTFSAQEMRERRKKRRETVDFHIVEFNAWAYVGTDHLWAGLVTHLYRETEKYFGLQLYISRLWQAAKRSLPKSLLIFAFYALLGLGVSLLANYNEFQEGWDALRIAINAFWGSVIGGTALASLPILFNTLKEFIDNLFLTRSKNLQNMAAKPDFRAQIGVMADIKSEISFIGRLLRKGKKGYSTRFILFIDDLDRCEHRKAVEVMQAIMLLLADEDGAPFIIFMGIDARVIVHAIEETYGDVLVKAGINGYEYLDKIVQVPFVIPGPLLDDIKQYVDSMLWSQEEKDLISKRRQATQPDDTTSTILSPGVGPPQQPEPAPTIPLEEISVSFTEKERSALSQCAEDLVDNPRKIKRIVNIYRFARLILPASLDRMKAVRWFLMTEQWPFHVAWIVEKIQNDLQTKKNEFANKFIKDVYKEAYRNIHLKASASLLGIDADPDMFELFIGKNNFTVQDVKELWPYTFNLNPAIRSEVNKFALYTE